MKRFLLLALLAAPIKAEDWRVLIDTNRVKVLEDVEPKPVSILGMQIVSFQSKTIFTDGKHGLTTYYFRRSRNGFEWALKREIWYFSDGRIAKSNTVEDSQLKWLPFQESQNPIDKARVERATNLLKTPQ
jgi:hypothetical protein